MKKRIKYMYEKGNSEYIDILLASDGLADFLNKSEYIGKISEYDSTMLDNYNQAKTALEEKRRHRLKKRKSFLWNQRRSLNQSFPRLIRYLQKEC